METKTVSVPDEIVLHILHFLDPREVVQLRRVSSQFNAVTRDARLWRALYVNSRVPRPSGPFLWQSRQFLERALIHSARLSQTWTSQPIGIVSSVQGPQITAKHSSASTLFDFLFGRLFVWCEGQQLLAQDIETGTGRLLWEGTGSISSIMACSLTLPDAERVFVAIRYVDLPINERTPIKLLEFPIHDDVRLSFGPVTLEIDLPVHASFPLFASTPFLYFDGGIERIFGNSCEPLVMDVRTRAMYTFPMFTSNFDEVIRREPRPWWPGFTLPSRNHILVFYDFSCWDPPTTLIQAFVAPDSSAGKSDTNIGQLRLSHEVLTECCHEPAHRLRDSVVDPVTGETIIRLLSTNTHHEQTHYLCVDLTIPPTIPGSTDVLSMLVTTQELFALPGYKRTVFFDASDDGHGRGIFTLFVSGPESPISDGDFPSLAYKFTIDASGEHCMAVVSKSNNLTSQNSFNANCSFDGVTGRFCHGVKARYKHDELVVLDLR